jgi:cation diffusion facilitator CzcD-associated flavoprotein CzcO
MRDRNEPDYEVIVVGGGVAGHLPDQAAGRPRGATPCVLEAAPDLGGTWYWNRYPGCPVRLGELHLRLLVLEASCSNEWHWKERFSGQPENLRYLNHVADKFDLRKHMQFNCEGGGHAHFDEARDLWRLKLGGRPRTDLPVRRSWRSGLLSAPTLPRCAEGTDELQGPLVPYLSTGRTSRSSWRARTSR